MCVCVFVCVCVGYHRGARALCCCAGVYETEYSVGSIFTECVRVYVLGSERVRVCVCVCVRESCCAVVYESKYFYAL